MATEGLPVSEVIGGAAPDSLPRAARPPATSVSPRPSVYQNGRLRYETRGLRVTPLTDLYHFLMSTAWWRLLAAFLFIYLAINGFFASFYWLGGEGTLLNARPGSFADCFWFSVQTFATIGYGNMSPATSYGHLLVTLESFSGMLSIALSTGILFAKFSKPVARVAFSKNALVHVRNGQACLIWRIANRRNGALLDAHVKAHALVDEISSEGHRMRRVLPLLLERPDLPMFMLSWTLIHPLDEKSPLFGLAQENAPERMLGMIVSFSGVDDSMVQTVHTRHTYTTEDMLFGRRFADMIDNTTPGMLIIDHSQLDELVPEGDA